MTAVRLVSVRYSDLLGSTKAWSLDGLTLGPVNLIVGRNATGKSRTLNLIWNLASAFVAGASWRLSDGEFHLCFDEDGVSLRYDLVIRGGSVSEETVTLDGVERMVRSNTGGSIFHESTGQKIPFRAARDRPGRGRPARCRTAQVSRTAARMGRGRPPLQVRQPARPNAPRRRVERLPRTERARRERGGTHFRPGEVALRGAVRQSGRRGHARTALRYQWYRGSQSAGGRRRGSRGRGPRPRRHRSRRGRRRFATRDVPGYVPRPVHPDPGELFRTGRVGQLHPDRRHWRGTRLRALRRPDRDPPP